MKRLLLAFVLCLMPVVSWAGNSFLEPSVAQEIQRYFGAAVGPYISSGCLPTVPGSSLTFAGFACTAFIEDANTPPHLIPVVQPSQAVTLANVNGTHWLGVCRDLTSTVGGWTRVTGSHYVHQQVTAQPANPTGCQVFAKVTVSGNVITEVGDYRIPASYATSGVYDVADPLYGAIPNDGLEDTTGIQQAFDAAKRGNVTIQFSPGVYEVDGTAQDGTTSIALDGVDKVSVLGYGATINQGTSSVRLLGIYRSSRVYVAGLRLIGNTFHAGANTEQYHGIAVGFNSGFVELTSLYITNFLGDQISIGGNFNNGSLLGYFAHHVNIHDNVLKERYGDGVRSYSNGSQSRWAVAIVECDDCQVHHNHIFGGVDLEPNEDGQQIRRVSVDHNQFDWGSVFNQATIGTDYNHDEPLTGDDDEGGSPNKARILSTVLVTGIPGSPLIQQVRFSDNQFDQGEIRTTGPYPADVINNHFQYGLIRVGHTSGGNSTERRNIIGNTAIFTHPNEDAFIQLEGHVSFSRFVDNRLMEGANNPAVPGYTISDEGVDTGDIGRNIFLGNTNQADTTVGGVLRLTQQSANCAAWVADGPCKTSIAIGNWANQGTSLELSDSPPIITASGSIDFGASIAAGETLTETLAVTGVVLGDPCFAAPATILESSGPRVLIYGLCRASSTDEIELSISNPTAGSINLTTRSWKVVVFRR